MATVSRYPFQLLEHDDSDDARARTREHLLSRPFETLIRSFAEDAARFVPGEQLQIAINTAVAVGVPLLITGEPGTGKTQAAYYAAYKLGVEPVIHFQVKSNCGAQDLLYGFDAVRYFRDAHLLEKGARLDKEVYVDRGPLWQALDSDAPRVLLIDEIDKAPRDFPNDLLLELDKMEFTVAETGRTVRAERRSMRPIVFITSNSERRLPEPFLRRCVYHHIRFDASIVEKAVESRREEYAQLSPDFLKLAVERFFALREQNLRKRPSTSELLVRLRVLALSGLTDPQAITKDLANLPYLGALVKDHGDLQELESRAAPSGQPVAT